jgi:putative hemolysin
VIWGQFLADQTWKLAVLFVLLCWSGFFSGSETALFSLSRAELHRFRHGKGAGRLVAALMDDPRRVLNTLLLGNMLVNTGYAAVSAVAIIELQHAGAPGWFVAVAPIVSLLVLILAGEVTPKMLAFAAGVRLAPTSAAVLAVLERLLLPILWLLETVLVVPLTRMLAPWPSGKADISTRELAALLDLSVKRGLIGHDANVLLQEIVGLTEMKVSEIMVPRVDMIAYDVDGPPGGLMKLLTATRHRKIPVYERDLDHVLGAVHAKQLLLEPTAPLRSLAAKLPFVPAAANLERVLILFRVTRTQMAIVVDEYGGTAGLVTLEDVLEQIVGDIAESHEVRRGPALEKISDQEYVVDGDLAIHEWVEAFRIDLSGRRISTIGGFVTSLLGRIPHPGDAARYRNLEFAIESMHRRRVEKLRIRLLEGGA